MEEESSLNAVGGREMRIMTVELKVMAKALLT